MKRKPRKADKVLDIGGEVISAERDSQWHVSRSIPAAFIVSMLLYTIVQTGTAAWFVSAMNQRIEAVEKAQMSMAQTVSPQGERLTRVEEKLEGVKSGISDIKIILTAQDNRKQNR